MGVTWSPSNISVTRQTLNSPSRWAIRCVLRILLWARGPDKRGLQGMSMYHLEGLSTDVVPLVSLFGFCSLTFASDHIGEVLEPYRADWCSPASGSSRYQFPTSTLIVVNGQRQPLHTTYASLQTLGGEPSSTRM